MNGSAQRTTHSAISTRRSNGRPDGLTGGVNSPKWTGFYRLEYGLWHGQSAHELTGTANTLAANVGALQQSWPSTEINLLDIGLRTHEILENALEFQLTGHDDYGSGTTLATTQANITGTLELLDHPAPAAGHPVRRAARRLHLAGPPQRAAGGGQDAKRAVDPGGPAQGQQPRADRFGLQPGPRGASTHRRHHRTAGYLMTEPISPGAPVPQHVDPATSAPNPRRRAFLLGGLGAGAVGAVAGVTGGYAYRATRAAPASEVALENAQAGLLPPVPFEGKYQAGILPQPQRQTAVIAFNATAQGRGELTDLFQTITARARFLTAGGTPPPVGIGGPPPDSGVLGATVIPDGLTVTLGVGSTLFDDRYGLAAQLPAKLTPMLPFPNDNLDPAQSGGDLVLQLSAGHADVVMHALRDIARHTRGGMQAAWRIDGFASPPRPAGTVPRNMLGFMDGISNPDVTSQAEMDSLVWIQPNTAGEPSWTAWRQLPRRAADQDAGGILGPGGHHRAGEHDRPPPRHRLPARLDAALTPRRSTRRTRWATSSRSPRTCGWPTRGPADRRQPHPAPRVQLRPRHGPGRQPGHRARHHLLPAGHQAGSSRQCRNACSMSRWSTTSARSAAAISWPCPGALDRTDYLGRTLLA